MPKHHFDEKNLARAMARGILEHVIRYHKDWLPTPDEWSLMYDRFIAEMRQQHGIEIVSEDQEEQE